MRSVKLLAATAVLAAFVAGPVLAQDAGGTMSPSTSTTTPKHHTHKKPVRHKKTTAGSTSTAPSGEGSTVTPAK